MNTQLGHCIQLPLNFDQIFLTICSYVCYSITLLFIKFELFCCFSSVPNVSMMNNSVQLSPMITNQTNVTAYLNITATVSTHNTVINA